MNRLVCSGYSRPGQTGWDLLDSFSLDVLLDVFYVLLADEAGPEGRVELDKTLNGLEEQMREETTYVEAKLSDGRVVKISEARLARIRANQGGVARMGGKKP